MICPTCKGTGAIPDRCDFDHGVKGLWCPREPGHTGYHARNDDPTRWWEPMTEAIVLGTVTPGVLKENEQYMFPTQAAKDAWLKNI